MQSVFLPTFARCCRYCLVVAYGEGGGEVGGERERSADAEFKDPSTENPELSNGASSEAGLSQK